MSVSACCCRKQHALPGCQSDPSASAPFSRRAQRNQWERKKGSAALMAWERYGAAAGNLASRRARCGAGAAELLRRFRYTKNPDIAVRIFCMRRGNEHLPERRIPSDIQPSQKQIHFPLVFRAPLIPFSSPPTARRICGRYSSRGCRRPTPRLCG